MTVRQGSAQLLNTDLARYLLQSTNLARISSVAGDGTPRVFPMLFHWTGQKLILATFAGAKKIEGIRRRPVIAVTIDETSTPPKVLLLRGTATVADVDGIMPEYRAMRHRYAGVEQGERNVAGVNRPGVIMARISLIPSWVGLLDFTTRFPGETSATEFENRG